MDGRTINELAQRSAGLKSRPSRTKRVSSRTAAASAFLSAKKYGTAFLSGSTDLARFPAPRGPKSAPYPQPLAEIVAIHLGVSAGGPSENQDGNQ